MPTIHLTPLIQHNHKYIALGSQLDKDLYAAVKSLAGVKWSRTHRTFYLPYSRENLNDVFQTLRRHNYYIDYSALNFSVKKKVKPMRTKREKIWLSEINETRFEQYKDYLSGLRLSESTIAAYGTFVFLFLHYLKDIELEQVGNDKVRLYVEYILKEKKYSISSHRQLIGAIKHFGELFTKTTIDSPSLVLPPKSSRLPIVLSRKELIDLLRATYNLKHRTILALMYSAGLRVSEVINLKLKDLDIDRRQIIIRQAKGRKDRYVVMAESFLPLLRNYITSYKPIEYFVEGLSGGQYSANSIRAFLRRSCKRAGISKNITPHTLRHSYATHLIENGVNLRYVQELLGHNKPETTMIYTHVARKDLLAIGSPLDDAVIRELRPDNKQLNISLSGNLKG